MAFSRLDRIKSELKKILSEAMYINARDAAFRNLTISDVIVAKDLSQAKVKIVREKDFSSDILKRLNNAGSFFRKIVAHEMKSLKCIPTITFEFDIDRKDCNRVLELIDGLSKDRIEKEREKVSKDSTTISTEIIDRLNASSNVLVCSHMNPDGDAFGSISFVCQYLKSLGKSFSAYSNHALPDEFRFIFTDIGIDLVTEIRHGMEDFDTFVVLDVGSLSRTGLDGIEDFPERIINIDHHISNDGFGCISYIDPDVSSTGEILFRIFKNNQIPFTNDLSNALYTAIYTDTGKFSYENTSASTLAVASELVAAHADPYKIFSTIYENRTEAEVKMFAEIISTLKIYAEKKAAVISVSKETFDSYKVNPFTLKEIVNFVRSISNVEVAIFFKELDKDFYKVSFRSKGNIDVNSLAGQYGGGGHHNASGASIKGTMADIIEELLNKI